MNRDTAEAIAAVIATAHQGCPSCVGDLCERMTEIAPGWAWVLREDASGDVVVAAMTKDEHARHLLTEQERDRLAAEYREALHKARNTPPPNGWSMAEALRRFRGGA